MRLFLLRVVMRHPSHIIRKLKLEDVPDLYSAVEESASSHIGNDASHAYRYQGHRQSDGAHFHGVHRRSAIFDPRVRVISEPCGRTRVELSIKSPLALLGLYYIVNSSRGRTETKTL